MDELKSLQHDLFQRYSLLRDLVHATLPPSEAPWQVLDVGSGPSRLTELALGPGYRVVRADVDGFGDDEIVVLTPGAPLPFGDASFDLVVNMDVLEHVRPTERSPFLRECARVASRLVVVACPVAHPAVQEAERLLGTLQERISGMPTDFLEEHAAFGLPDEAATVAFLAELLPDVAILPNAPIDSWVVFNLLDYAVNLVAGPSEDKDALNRELNEGMPLSCPADRAYRRLFIAGDPTLVDASRAVATAHSREIPEAELLERIAAGIAHLAALSWAQRRELAASLGELESLRRFGTSITAMKLALLQVEARLRKAERERTLATSRAETLRAQLALAREQLDGALEELAQRPPAERTVVVEVPVPQPISARELVRRAPRGAARRLRRIVRQAIGRNGRVDNAGGATAPVDELPAPPALFDAAWYLAVNADVREAGVDPWHHYVEHGASEGRRAHPLFDGNWYLERYPDVRSTGQNPLVHYATVGWREGRDPNPLFDVRWYLAQYPDVAATGEDPLTHYAGRGWREGRRPGPGFDPGWYLREYADVREAGMEPLGHFLLHGQAEGRAATPLDAGRRRGERYVPPVGLLPWFNPLSVRVVPALSSVPKLNVLLPGMGMRHMTGGPNTVIQLAARLALRGEQVRFIATDAPLDADLGPLHAHIAALVGADGRIPTVDIVDGSDRSVPVEIGDRDVFMASAWWTAQMVKHVVPQMRFRRFLYVVQDFEPLFYPSSTQYALALETYGLDMVPIVNTSMLFEELVSLGVGVFADPVTAARAVVFEPSVDRELFRPVPKAGLRRRLLFYTRPVNGQRNLFELGVAALQLAVHEGVFDEGEWEFLGMGDPFSPVALGGGAVLEPVPWKELEGYAEQMRESDVLLAPMLSPHPSYPPLEMAACGRPVVTTVFGSKSAARLSSISPNIIGVDATVEALAAGIARAVRRADDWESCIRAATIALPGSWAEALEPVMPRIESALAEVRSRPDQLAAALTGPPAVPYERWRARRRAERTASTPLPPQGDTPTISFMTPVWNTDGAFLDLLARCLFEQTVAGGWEWVITDNGSDRAETLEVLDRIVTDPRVRLVRCAENSGILGGMRSCLEAAAGSYVVHLDHDDLLTQDAAEVVIRGLAAAGWPAAFYTDEDKLRGGTFADPFVKPGWDPVLLANTCYVAHLCGVRRDVALALGAYDDPLTEASPDWDLFMRLLVAGYRVEHLPHVLYSWRVHELSTADNPGAKPYAASSHRRVLERFVAARGSAHLHVLESNPLSPGGSDWWIRRRRETSRPVVTAVVGGEGALEAPAGVPHRMLRVDDLPALRAAADDAVRAGALLHILSGEATPLDDEWVWEVQGIMELHPETVCVGGATIRDGRVESAGDVFGFGWGCESPGAGLPERHTGWMVMHSKQRTVDAVAADHLVVDPSLVIELLDGPDAAEVRLPLLGPWLGLAAARAGARVVWSPFVRARIGTPLASGATVEDRRRFLRALGDRLGASPWRSQWLSLDPRDPDQVVEPERRSAHLERLRAQAAVVEPYAVWLEQRIRSGDRSGIRPTSAAPTLGVITPVYAGTDPALLEELAFCLETQELPPTCWAIAPDGELPSALEAVLGSIASRFPWVRRGPAAPRRGILATMRAALELLDTEYVVPVDADDLLTPDALAILAAAAEESGRPPLVYSDEDILDHDGPRDPYLRPDWDPVLHLESSYVWHAIAYRRDLAVAVGCYEDRRFDWCHDWDTLDRFAAAGYEPVHVREVLYHWRRHGRSSTNTDRPVAEQQASVDALLLRAAERCGLGHRYRIEPVPFWRGAAERHLARTAAGMPDVALVVVGEPTAALLRSIARTTDVELAPVVAVHPTGEGGCVSCGQVADALGALPAEVAVVVVIDPAAEVLEEGWLEEAVKFLELVPSVDAVSSRLLALDGTVVGGGEVRDDDGVLVAPLLGRRAPDPGPYALALKPATVDRVTTAFVVGRRSALAAAARSNDEVPWRLAGTRLAATLASSGRRVAWSPMLSAVIPGVPRLGDDVPSTQGPLTVGRRGLGGFSWAASRFWSP